MLQDLVRMDDIEARLFHAIQAVPSEYVPDFKPHICYALFLCVFPRFLDNLGGWVDGIDEALRNTCREINANRAWPAADVKDLEREIVEVWDEMWTGVLDRAPAVGSEDGGVVAVDVGTRHYRLS
jgi:hypothetical protein